MPQQKTAAASADHRAFSRPPSCASLSPGELEIPVLPVQHKQLPVRSGDVHRILPGFFSSSTPDSLRFIPMPVYVCHEVKPPANAVRCCARRPSPRSPPRSSSPAAQLLPRRQRQRRSARRRQQKTASGSTHAGRPDSHHSQNQSPLSPLAPATSYRLRAATEIATVQFGPARRIRLDLPLMSRQTRCAPSPHRLRQPPSLRSSRSCPAAAGPAPSGNSQC